jgi:uncharacterized protein DUF2516
LLSPDAVGRGYSGVVNVIGFESSVMSIVYLALLAVKVFAFIDATVRPTAAFPAAEKMTKPAWMLILGLAVVCDILLGSLLLVLAGTVAAFVYILDVRPALASVTRRR